MMKDCPKCGFNQPEDRYCAQCGVDMEQFQPKPKPIWIRLSNRPAFHVSMAALIAIALFSFIYVTQRKDIDETLLNAFSDETETQNFVAETSTPTPTPQNVGLRTTAAPAQENFEQENSTEDELTPTPTDTAVPTSAQVSYAEVPRPLIEIWLREGQLLNETANTRSILLAGSSDIKSYSREEWNLFELPGKRTLALTTDAARGDYLQTSTNSSNEVTEIGFVIDLSTSTKNQDIVAFDLQMLVSLPSGLDGDVTSSTMTGSYRIPAGSTLVLLGGLPQQSARGEAAKIFMNTPLQILQSPEYLSGSSEFAIFIQPK